MRRSIFFTISTLLACGFFSCKKDVKGTDGPVPSNQQNLLIGKWMLQQEQFTRYVDSAKQLDTTFDTSANNLASIQFNKDGTFDSQSSFYSPGTANQAPFTSGGASSGNYVFVGNTFGLSDSINGLRHGVDFFGGTITSGSAPVITPVSNLAEIKLLTSSKLNIHTVFVCSYLINGIVQTYKMTDDYYYAR
ncbi:MAG TPA: DUF5004 domain-containing protein [Mucilaginibacter sp.]|nr:DUF5004 domain-containing protein [Mucilaginibacter sp.]